MTPVRLMVKWFPTLCKSVVFSVHGTNHLSSSVVGSLPDRASFIVIFYKIINIHVPTRATIR